ncbi:MAG: FAD-dependent oxidoreductase [Burkholderiaceae bacterium]
MSLPASPSAERPALPPAGTPAVAVVGAGWSGLAAAVALAEAGLRVTVFESAPQAGGRARTTELETPFGRIALDNGQHLIVGAYRRTLALVERLGAAPRLHRHPMHLASSSGLSLRAAPLPAPLHLGWGLLRARGLAWRERAALVRLMGGLRRAGWTAPEAETVESMLGRFRQPARLVERLWAPLCVGALNTLPTEACARTFAAVLRDTLGAAADASDFVAPDAPLGALLPEPALDRLRRLGASVRLRATVRELRASPSGWRVGGDDEAYAALLLALPPGPRRGSSGRSAWTSTRCRPSSPSRSPRPGRCGPPATPRLPRWLMLDEDPARRHFGQWSFDRGVIGAARVAGVVVSAASRIADEAPEAVARGIADQLQQAVGGPRAAAVRVVTERRATFRCTPARPRLACDHYAGRASGLWLAGDWLWPDYPATLESAVRSGQQAASGIVASLGGRDGPRPASVAGLQGQAASSA